MVIFQLITFNTTWLYTKKTNLSVLPEIDKKLFLHVFNMVIPIKNPSKKRNSMSDRRTVEGHLHGDEAKTIDGAVGPHTVQIHGLAQRLMVTPNVFLLVLTTWCPPVISWFISPSNYSYKFHKP